MNCQESREQIAGLLQGDLPDKEAGCLREHLHSCPTCWQEWQELNETWARLGLLPDEQPSQNLRRDFYRRLEASRRELAATERQPLRERLPGLLSRLRSLAGVLLPASPAMRLAAAVLVVAVGFGAGFFMGHGQENGSGKIERLSREVDSLQQQMTLSLLSQPSASARLQGIALTSRVQEPEPCADRGIAGYFGQRSQRQRAPIGGGRPLSFLRPRAGALRVNRLPGPADIAAGADRADRPAGLAEGKAGRDRLETAAGRQEDPARGPAEGAAGHRQDHLTRMGELAHFQFPAVTFPRQPGITSLNAIKARR